MNRKNTKPYLLLLIVLVLLISVPPLASEKIRGTVIRIFAPAWEFLAKKHISSSIEEEAQRLKLENQLLKTETTKLKELFQQERQLTLQLIGFSKEERQIPQIQSLVKQHLKEMRQQLMFRLQALPARVIFRSPSSWGSSLWLNVGEADNSKISRMVIAKNSPVLLGNSIVGVVDYVGKHQCRVRLITDSGLTPSVRAVRGDIQRHLVFDSVSQVIESLSQHQGLFSTEEKQIFKTHIQALREGLLKDENKETWYLSKGELHGSSKPMWRSQGYLLQGIGFNYDFSDEYGPARDLRSGAPTGTGTAAREGIAIPILKINDLLVTTGMDGVFPAGLYVAEVVKIKPLREGDYYYELEARPTAGDLQELSLVYVIPPIGYDTSDQPPDFWAMPLK